MKKSNQIFVVVGVLFTLAVVAMMLAGQESPLNDKTQGVVVSSECESIEVTETSILALSPIIRVSNLPITSDLLVILTQKSSGISVPVAHYDFTDPYDFFVLNGSATDKDQNKSFDFDPGTYTLRGYNGPRDTVPADLTKGILFEYDFTIKDCNK
jgi:hypothetical protein